VKIPSGCPRPWLLEAATNGGKAGTQGVLGPEEMRLKIHFNALLIVMY